ncbi:hypothetical protein B0H17DRAFT_1213241 [Mycena rosella]|uniref:Carboxylic ester hydrolase n=1 Tax=Mycena rosella TaxID=1033263 RepID=A0AAD7G5D5_MYCRO|nr:hypothetical protein B0H17DRAFT_1213241 [Mycena rosella]
MTALALASPPLPPLPHDPSVYDRPSLAPSPPPAPTSTCDALDGLVDGIISEPDDCYFRPEILACTGTPMAGCLTPPQLDAVRNIYSPLVGDHGQFLYPRYSPSAEAEPIAGVIFGSSFFQFTALISSTNSKRVYNLISETLAMLSLDEFYRLFLIPGMSHCFGGLGAPAFGQGTAPDLIVVNASSHNILLALVDWVEWRCTRDHHRFRGE